jgi:hypothetical protein
MTIATKAGITAGVLGAFWLGVLAAPSVRHGDSPVEQIEVVRAADASPTPTAAPRVTEGPSVSETRATAMAASAEPVQKHAKSLLSQGTDTSKAADGFANAEQFVTVAYAAKNTEVPFVLLKHRVLNENQSLAEAIRTSKPELDATLEADRARLEARATLARMTD